MERFVNKNVFLTGAASGIGKATARRLANEGAKLIIADVNQKLLDETSKELKDSCLLYTSPSPRDRNVSRMPSSA